MSKNKMIQAPEASRKEFRQVDLREEYPDTPRESTPANDRKLQRVVDRGKFTTLAAQVAQHNFYERNFKYRGADQLYPNQNDVNQRFVTKHFPMAKGGPLLVSEPRGAYEVKKAWEKHAVLKKQGFRHIVLEDDTKFDQALEQLGEL